MKKNPSDKGCADPRGKGVAGRKNGRKPVNEQTFARLWTGLSRGGAVTASAWSATVTSPQWQIMLPLLPTSLVADYDEPPLNDPATKTVRLKQQLQLAFKTADTNKDFKINAAEWQALCFPKKIEVDILLQLRNTIKVTGNVHIIKRISTKFSDFELWLDGRNINSQLKSDIGITLTGTYTQSWENMPILDKFCPPYVCYKTKLGESAYVMLGLGLNFNVAAFVEFMAKITFGYKKELDFKGNMLVHQVVVGTTSHKVQKVDKFAPDGSKKEEDPKAGATLNLEVEVMAKLEAKFTVMLGLWADFTPAGGANWLISKAAAEFSVEVSFIASMTARLHLLKTLYSSSGSSSKLYPLVGDSSLPLCGAVDAIAALFSCVATRKCSARTCGARVQELMKDGMDETAARNAAYKESGSCKICAYRHADDYLWIPASSLAACQKEHELHMDVTFEFMLEAKLTAYLALDAAGGTIKFRYGKFAWFFMRTASGIGISDATPEGRKVKKNGQLVGKAGKGRKGAQGPFLLHLTVPIVAYCTNIGSAAATQLAAPQEQALLPSPPEEEQALLPSTSEASSPDQEDMVGESDDNGENDGSGDNGSGDENGDNDGSDPSDDIPDFLLATAGGGGGGDGHMSALMAAGMRPHHAAGVSDGDPLLFRHRFQHHDAASGALTYYQYEARRHAHVVVLEAHQIEGCSFEQLPKLQGHDLPTVGITLTLRADSEHRHRLARGAILLTDGYKCAHAAATTEAALQVHLIAEPVEVAHNRPGLVNLLCMTTPAKLHELFEYTTVEYYQGKPERLEHARARRTASLHEKNETNRAVTPPRFNLLSF
jgi:hypothetical protein